MTGSSWSKYSRGLVIVYIAIFILRLPGVYQPILNLDESVFGEFANRILEGDRPFADIVDNKPPLLYYFFALIYFFLGRNNLIAVHVVTTLIVMATAFMIFTMGKMIKNEQAGFFSALLFTALAHTYEPKYISTSGETLMNLPLVLSVFLFIKHKEVNKKSIKGLISVGMLLGLAFLIHFKAGMTALVFAVYSIFFNGISLDEKARKRTMLREWLRLSLVGLSSFIPFLFIFAYFNALGNLQDFFTWGILYNLKYIERGMNSVPLYKTAFRFIFFILCSFPVWIAIAFFIKRMFGDVTKKRKGVEISSRENLALLFLWLAFSVFAAGLGGRAYAQYFIQIIPPLSILGGLAFSSLYPDKKKWVTLSWVYLGVFASVFFMSRINIQYTYKIINYPNYKAELSFKKIGRYIQLHSRPNDRIFVWGWGGPVYFYSDRRCSSKFIVADFVSGRVFGTPNDSKIILNTQNSPPWEDFISELADHPPYYFLDTSPSDYFGYRRFPLSRFPSLDHFIKQKYNKSITMDGVVLYLRNP